MSNRALHFYENLRFHPVDNEALLFYSKMTRARDSIVLVILNLDPMYTQSGYIEAPIEEFGEIGVESSYEVHDLLTNTRYVWHGNTITLRFIPGSSLPHFSRPPLVNAETHGRGCSGALLISSRKRLSVSK